MWMNSNEEYIKTIQDRLCVAESHLKYIREVLGLKTLASNTKIGMIEDRLRGDDHEQD